MRTIVSIGLLVLMTGCNRFPLDVEVVERSMFLVAHVMNERGEPMENVSIAIPATNDQTATDADGNARALRVTIGSARTHTDFRWADPETHEWQTHNNVRVDIDPDRTTNHRWFVIRNDYVSVTRPPT